MIFNCLNCGISISTRKETCSYCKTNNSEVIEMLMGRPTSGTLTNEKIHWKEKFKGTILAHVLR